MPRAAAFVWKSTYRACCPEPPAVLKPKCQSFCQTKNCGNLSMNIMTIMPTLNSLPRSAPLVQPCLESIKVVAYDANQMTSSQIVNQKLAAVYCAEQINHRQSSNHHRARFVASTRPRPSRGVSSRPSRR